MIEHKTTSKPVSTHQPCPDCPSTDAYTHYTDGHGFCFSCNTYFPPPKGSSGVYRTENYSNNCTFEYVPLRGILKSTLEFYDTKTKINSEGKPVSIGFRYPNGSFKIRDLAKKDFRTEDAPDGSSITKAGLFGRDKFSAGGGRSVTITEGELDALSLYQALGGYPVVSIQSSVFAGRDCALDRAWINSFEKIYLAFDGDEPGRRACDEVARLFDFNKVYAVRFTKRKDANAFVEAGESEELKRIWWNARKYQPETIVSTVSEFKDILSTPPKWGVPYPFKRLTEMTYGIRTGESVLITAQEKVGKTELLHFIEHKLLKECEDAVGAIYLEEPKQRHLQALAGIELKLPVHLPDCECTPQAVCDALEKVVRGDDRLHIYSHFGSDDPNVILDTIRFLVTARGCRYIILDHIGMVVSGLAGEDERKALDFLSTRLEMMVKELDFALILVSHVNDSGQTRGSRYISKVADTRIDITRDLTHPDPVVKRTWSISLAYSRFSGQSGSAGKIVYDPDTYSFSEDAEFAFAKVGANDNGPDSLRSAA